MFVRRMANQFPLGSLITIDVVAEPRSSLPHFNQLNSATVGAVPPGTAMGDAINWFENRWQAQTTKGYNHDYMGEARQYV